MYRLNLFILSEIANKLENDCAKDWKQNWVFGSDFDYGSEIPCEMCEKFNTCELINQEYFDNDFIAIDDWIGEPEYVEEYNVESSMDNEVVEYGLEVSDTPGIKYCLRDSNVICYEDCYDDQTFCETVVFLGYPDEKVKYPNAYPIASLPKWAIGR